MTGLLVAALVVAAVYVFVSRSNTPSVTGLAPQGVDPLADNALEPGAYRGLYSPDGSKLAVLSADGLGLAERGKVRPITPRGSRVVDAAWFAGSSALLVAEGPVPTGQLAVVDTEGKDKGIVTLAPSFGVGSGFGMSVSPDNTHAVLTAVERPTLGQTDVRWLVLVDLATGRADSLTPKDSLDETGPLYLDNRTVLFTARAVGGRSVVRTIDLETDEVTDVPGIGSTARAVGVLGTGSDFFVVVSGRSIEAEPRAGGAGQHLGTVPKGSELVAVHPSGTVALVATPVVAGAAGTELAQSTQLRGLRLSPPKRSSA